VTKEGYSLEQARSFYRELDDDERQLIHQRYERFSALSPEERDDLRLRSRNLERISEASQNQSMPPELATKLKELSPRDRKRFRQSLLSEELREKGRKLLDSMPENSRRELEETTGARERAAFMLRYKQVNIARILQEMIRRAGRRLDVPKEETQRILALTKGDRLRAFLELNVGLTEEELLRIGLPFGITPEQWEKWRKLSAEDFFAEVVQHRERKRWKRRANRRRVQMGGDYPEPDADRLAGLVQLLEAVRKRPRDFVELADLDRGSERRLELGKRKRALCTEAIKTAKLAVPGLIAEIEYMNAGTFFGFVRSIIDDAGGPQLIQEWSGVELREPR